jgi:hypothetical protein
MSDTTTNDGGPAFPETFVPGTSGFTLNMHPGMTLRDYFAAEAMAAIIGLLRNEDVTLHGMRPGELRINCAAGAYMLADAMLARRSGK